MPATSTAGTRIGSARSYWSCDSPGSGSEMRFGCPRARCRTARALTSAERSVIEVYVDMELIHQDVIDAGVEKFHAFSDLQKLHAARRKDAFFAAHPDLDGVPSKATVHREFIRNNAVGVEAQVERLWGKGSKPRHWSGLNLLDRSRNLGKETELLVVDDYDRRNFSVHAGLTGVLNLSQTHFEGLC